MPNEITVNKAHENYENIVRLRKTITLNFWQLVLFLKESRINEYWKKLDYDSWASFLAQPEIDFNTQTVDNYITIYNKLSEINGNQLPPAVVNVDISKLQAITPYLTKENADELIGKAKTLSRSDLRKEITDLRYKNKITTKIPNDKFDVIYADPPWKYQFSETSARMIENHYPTMDLQEIKDLQIPSADNSILFMWATAPKVEESIQVLNAWGFTYKTCAVWDKEIIGMGYWFRGQHELLLVGVKGNFLTPAENVRSSSVYREKRTRHSKKPTYFYNLIEKYFPNNKYLELFARQKHNDKWTVWGNEI